MANEQTITHVAVTLDQPMIQTIRMGLSQLQLAAAQVENHLNLAVQSAIDAANPPPPREDEEAHTARGPQRAGFKGPHA